MKRLLLGVAKTQRSPGSPRQFLEQRILPRGSQAATTNAPAHREMTLQTACSIRMVRDVPYREWSFAKSFPGSGVFDCAGGFTPAA